MWIFLRCQDYSYATNSNYAIDMQNIHCMAHQSNLVIQAFYKLNMVYNLENIVQTLYAYFNKSPKRHLELIKLVEIMEIQDNKSLKNCQNNVDFFARTFKEGVEWTLHFNGQDDFKLNINDNYAKVNFKFLCEIEVLYGLEILLSLLEEMNSLMKLTQVLWQQSNFVK